VQGVTAEERGAWSIGNCSDFSKYVTKRQLTSDILDWNSAYIEAARDDGRDVKSREPLARLGEGGYCRDGALQLGDSR
jgi:basic membrane lipoprotein Med (substrate-binding protein (PBP1-ABC) superfamily)